jgi:hypothetical protein
MTNDSESVTDFPQEDLDRLVRDVGKYSVAVLGVRQQGDPVPLHFIGSGSLVSVSEACYILTAAHVWREIKRYPKMALTLKEAQDHCFSIDTESVVATTSGAVQTVEWGPDLAFLHLPPESVSTIEAAQGVFYNMSKRKEAALRTAPEMRFGVWLLMGAPAASAVLRPNHAALQITGFLAAIPRQHNRYGFDYLDVNANLSSPGVPRSFGGVSGGGLWHIMTNVTSKRQFWWSHEGINLEGVAFYQSDQTEGRRFIRCHGRQTIYEFTSGLPGSVHG